MIQKTTSSSRREIVCVLATVRADVDFAGIAAVTLQEPMLHREGLSAETDCDDLEKTTCEELDRHG
jgi:hypothetical protein